MTATGFDPDALAALEEEREFLLRSLDDLERERTAGDIDEADYVTLRDDYTARAAAVLHAIDGHPVTPAAPRGRRRARAVVGVVVVAGLAVGAGLALATASGTRRPGQVLTGGPSVPSGGADLLIEAAAKVREGEILEALRLYDAVLEDDPINAAALTYKGWLLVNVGSDAGRAELTERGRQLLERATAADPDYPDGWFFHGFYLLRVADDPERAKAAFLRALASDPVEDLAAEARRALAEIEGAAATPPAGG